MSTLVALAAVADFALLLFVAQRILRSRNEGLSLRLRIFAALATATLLGALLTGTYATFEEALRTGVEPVVARIAPKAFLVASALLFISAAGATAVGRRLARGVEEVTEAASRIADGELDIHLPRGRGREAQRLARALASMRTELEGRPYAAAFLRDAWHDLKTPAAAIKATLELLEDGIDDPEVYKRFLGNLRRASDQLERTLDDLVMLARFETATLAPEETKAIGDVVREAVANVRPLADAKAVAITAPPDGPSPRLRCDASALTRAVGNLLENGVVASPGGKVEVAYDDAPGTVVVEVSNEPGEVPVEMRDRLFQRAATSRRGSGSGLGLAIARAAVEAHGGRIRFVELGPPRVKLRIELPRG